MEQTFETLIFFVQICLLADLHGGSQPLSRNPRLGNFKRCKGIAIVRRGGWRVYRGARGNTIHPHLKIDIFKEINYKKRSKIVKKTKSNPKSQLPPPQPTQLPETVSNSPPRLLPLLGGEEGFCFLSGLFFNFW